MAELKILIHRKYKKEKYTIGIMYINGIRFSNTMEDKDRGLRFDMNPKDILNKKVYGQTAIPTGIYRVEMTYSPKFANRAWCSKEVGKSPQIMNVPGFGGIRIHPLNTAEDSLGCIGVGENTVKGKITNSTYYYRKLIDNYIMPAIKRGDTITLEII